MKKSLYTRLIEVFYYFNNKELTWKYLIIISKLYTMEHIDILLFHTHIFHHLNRLDEYLSNGYFEIACMIELQF